MSEKNSTPINKVKLNYMSAVSRTPPKARIPVSSARMEELDKAIREKTKQNTDQFNMARDNFQDDVVKSNL